MNFLGNHSLVEYYECDKEILNDQILIEKIITVCNDKITKNKVDWTENQKMTKGAFEKAKRKFFKLLSGTIKVLFVST